LHERPAVIETVAEIHRALADLGATVAVAESLTGGLLTAALTEPAGASAFVRGGLVVYATDLKAVLAGVDADLLASRGAVDPAVAAALARGARDRLGAPFGVGVTGVAGPDPQDGQPVGTVFGAIAGPRDEIVDAWTLPGTRAEIRASAVDRCLALLLRECRAAA
jgi:nicotinamide-nucleotide amidase